MTSNGYSAKASGNAGKFSQGNKYITLKSMRNLRSWFKDARSDDVQDVIRQLELIKKEKLRQEEENIERNQRHQEMCDFYSMTGSSSIMEVSIDPQDVLDALTDSLSCCMRRYRSARVKYRFYDLDGNLCEWSGQGREPLKLRDVMTATGKSRDDFLVRNDDQNNSFLIDESCARLSESMDRKFKQFSVSGNQSRRSSSTATPAPGTSQPDSQNLSSDSQFEQDDHNAI